MAKNRTNQERSVDLASQEMLDRADKLGLGTAFSRADAMPACPIGMGASPKSGICCKNCYMGPCRLVKEGQVGVCGATIATVAARNLARMVAAGSASHSDHGRDIAFTLLAAAEGQAQGYQIRDEAKLRAVARKYGIAVDKRKKEEIARDVALKAVAQFGQQTGELIYLKTAPKKRQEKWKKYGVAPRGIDREVVDVLHRTHIGDDQDAEHILKGAIRCALSDGWGGSMVATDLSDILFGTPSPRVGQVNLGVLKQDEVNVVLHGHEPTLSEMIVAAASDPDLIAYAESKGAKGINLAGICCTSNEVLLRQGVASAGNFHTKFITTSSKVKITGGVHIEFDEHKALEQAREIVKIAIDNYANRGETVIPDRQSDLVPGFSHEYINYMLGGTFRASFRPLNDAIMTGRIRGVVADVGCNNARTTQDAAHNFLVREFLSNDLLVIETACGSLAS